MRPSGRRRRNRSYKNDSRNTAPCPSLRAIHSWLYDIDVPVEVFTRSMPDQPNAIDEAGHRQVQERIEGGTVAFDMIREKTAGRLCRLPSCAVLLRLVGKTGIVGVL